MFIFAGIARILCYGLWFGGRTPPALALAAVPLAVAGAADGGENSRRTVLILFKAGSLTFGSGLVIVPSRKVSSNKAVDSMKAGF